MLVWCTQTALLHNKVQYGEKPSQMSACTFKATIWFTVSTERAATCAAGARLSGLGLRMASPPAQWTRLPPLRAPQPCSVPKGCRVSHSHGESLFEPPRLAPRHAVHVALAL